MTRRKQAKFAKVLNEFVDAHNAVLAAEEPTEAQRAAQLWAAMRVLEAAPDAGGPAGELDFDAIMAEADQRFGADIRRPALVVAVPKQLANGAEFEAAHAEALAAAEAAYKARVDQTVAIAGSVVKALAGLAATAAI